MTSALYRRGRRTAGVRTARQLGTALKEQATKFGGRTLSIMRPLVPQYWRITIRTINYQEMKLGGRTTSIMRSLVPQYWRITIHIINYLTFVLSLGPHNSPIFPFHSLKVDANGLFVFLFLLPVLGWWQVLALVLHILVEQRTVKLYCTSRLEITVRGADNKAFSVPEKHFHSILRTMRIRCHALDHVPSERNLGPYLPTKFLADNKECAFLEHWFKCSV